MIDAKRTQDVATLSARITAMPGRRLIALAGPPGAGKSTLAEALVAALPGAVLVAMDGFHLDNALLAARGLLRRKGAPETFDAAGFVHAMRRLKAGEEVALPGFDRARDLSIAGVQVVPPEAQVIVVEGNYLLLDAPPWDGLAPLWDLSVFLSVPMPELERRLVARWQGFGVTQEQAQARARGNDLANAALVNSQSRAADITLGG